MSLHFMNIYKFSQEEITKFHAVYKPTRATTYIEVKKEQVVVYKYVKISLDFFLSHKKLHVTFQLKYYTSCLVSTLNNERTCINNFTELGNGNVMIYNLES